LDAHLVEVGNDLGGVGNAAEAPVQFRHDDDCFALLGRG
jgi:hypothetical protein